MTDPRIVITADGSQATREFDRVTGSMKSLPAAARTAQTGLDGMGMSAAQTAAAMRGVPAQITDIITSLQGGQAPITVFLQQGGQLRDMFGGVGAAAKALSSTVVGMINPLTLTAAAVGAVGLAWYQGSQEAAAYEKALTLSGNAIGVTTGQLEQMASTMAASVGTQGQAAAALAEMAGSSKIAARDLQAFTEVAIEWERATGQSIADTRKAFEQLAGSPLDALLKLNEGTNFLTASLFDQVKALEDQGKKTEAAEVAQRGYAAALDERAKKIQGNLGLIERAWAGVTGAAKSAWDAMLNIGREGTQSDALAKLDAQIEATRRRAEGGYGASVSRGAQAQLAALQEQREAMVETMRLSERMQTREAERAAAERAAVAERAAAYKQESATKKEAERSAASASKARIKAIEDEKRAREQLDEVVRKALERDDERQAKEDAADAAASLRMWEAQAAARITAAEAAQKAAVSFSDSIAAIQFETEALRMSTSEREFAVEMRKLEAMGVEQGTEAWNAYAEALRGAIDERAQVRAGIESAKEFEQTWQRTSNQIGQAFANSLMDGGKSAAEQLKRLFSTLVLQPIVNAVVNPVSQGITSAISGGGSGGLSLAGSLGSLGSLGSFAATGFMNTVAGSGMMGGLSAAGSLMQGGSVMSGLGMGLGAVAPYALAAAAIYSLLKRDGGGPKTGGSYASDGSRMFTPADQDAVAATFADSLYSGYQQAVQKLGGTPAQLAYGLGFDMDPLGDANSRVSTTLGSYSAIDVEAGRSDEELAAGVALATNRAIIAGLQQSDIPRAVSEMLAGVDAASLSSEAADAILVSIDAFAQLAPVLDLLDISIADLGLSAITTAGGIDKFGQIASTYYDLTRTEAEKFADSADIVSAAFADLGVEMPASMADLRTVVEALQASAYGATDEGQNLATSLMALAPALESVVGPVEAATDAFDALAGRMTSSAAAAIENADGWPTADDWIAYAQAIGDPEIIATSMRASFTEAWERLDTGLPVPQSIEEYTAAIDTLNATALYSEGVNKKLDGALGLAASATASFGVTAVNTADQISQSINTLNSLRTLYTASEYKTKMTPLLEADFAEIFPDGLTAMPTTAAAFKALVDSITDPTVLSALGDFYNTWDDVFVTVEKVTPSAQKATKSVNTFADTMRTSMQSVADFVQSLYVGDLAIGSPEDQFNYAQSLYTKTLAAAPYSAEAMADLPGFAAQYARLGQEMYGTSTGGYAALIEMLRTDLRALLTPAGSSRGDDISRDTLSEIRTGNRLSTRQLRVTERASARPSYVY